MQRRHIWTIDNIYIMKKLLFCNYCHNAEHIYETHALVRNPPVEK
ncbi:MAG: hypothetical protein JETT_1886 [Candidatus Jettenia ecosi]|uniref:Uncharacterized protein n=1 Tax=Candidatus Jettenia ecosi TaxID=2494326 RepID=A0A533QBS4_9BACT|nr:MAG: hypothetical protein JETT_1886 [Candidatus Jettenia ecosi]